MIYVTNTRSTTLHGPGRVLSIMAWPPKDAKLDGSVCALKPNGWLLYQYKQGKLSLKDYRNYYLTSLPDLALLKPGALMATVPHDLPDYKSGGSCRFGSDETKGPKSMTLAEFSPVVDGDTLVCVCSLKDASDGRCHRVWAAERLVEAGWEVRLDGR